MSNGVWTSLSVSENCGSGYVGVCFRWKAIIIQHARWFEKAYVIYHRVHTSIKSQGPRHPLSALCAWYRQHLAFLMKTSLNPQDLRELYSIPPSQRAQCRHEWSECCFPSGIPRMHLDSLMETATLKQWSNWQPSYEVFQLWLHLNVMTITTRGRKTIQWQINKCVNINVALCKIPTLDNTLSETSRPIN